ncbi:hypothetical protein L596_028686 [Steinernema carpocapsae]|uniref:Uncharacterized protein n=1 Tax=Steinernema carpocapsae TaxID=34508 RepID=A0A4U5M054_STECR|nr:hypothetical protein L596_028686 [Steinernema carpocapsae]
MISAGLKSTRPETLLRWSKTNKKHDSLISALASGPLIFKGPPPRFPLLLALVFCFSETRIPCFLPLDSRRRRSPSLFFFKNTQNTRVFHSLLALLSVHSFLRERNYTKRGLCWSLLLPLPEKHLPRLLQRKRPAAAADGRQTKIETRKANF